MKVFINAKNEIKDVNSTTDASLTMVEIPEGVFDDWSEAKILCYKVCLLDGAFAGFTPAVDTRIIEHLDNLGKANERNASDVTDIQMAMAELYEMSMEV